MAELPKQYDPKGHEQNIYEQWENENIFSPNEAALKEGKEPYTIMLPLPNVTGSLHMGHALQHTISDILIRYHRMKGDPTLWQPGTDHAGIATQNVVEKQLKEEGKNRHDIGREKFLDRVWKWKEESGNQIFNQMKRLGASPDWSRNTFTMDDEYYKAVQQEFVHYYEQGYIYRGNRIVNWCPQCESVISDLEVKHEEHNTKLMTLEYHYSDGTGSIKVATTRPETMLGDTAVAVHPEDERYQDAIGKKVTLPLTDREIEVITDDRIEKDFGTGAVKITPAHDPLDATIGETHKLAAINVIGQDGLMTKEAGEFAGLSTKEARKAVMEALRKIDAVVNEEDYRHTVSICDRCDTIIEPLISRQWFVDMDKIKDETIDVAENEVIKFLPPRWKKHFLDWMENVHDWTISRQLWWGHRIPVWWKHSRKPVKITFIRHGESQANAAGIGGGHSDSGLTSNGKQAVSALAEQLEQSDIDAIYTSDLQRAVETADIIFNDNITKDKRLREIDYGQLTGKPTEEINKHRVSGYPDGESYQELLERFLDFLAEVIEKHEGQHIAIVAHSGIRKILDHIISGQPLNYDLLTSKSSREPLTYELNSIWKVSTESPGQDWAQDPDVLDTWFSSALWPFATLGWPNATEDLERFYPTSVLITARDILYLWVARMIFSGLDLMQGEEYGDRDQAKRIPFKEVFIHPTVLAKDGQRMSKSLGTGVDPLELIDEYGADATRFGLMHQMSYDSQAVKFDPLALRAARNFANKIWNIARLLDSLEERDEETIADTWIQDHANATSFEASKLLEEYKIGEAARLIQDFIWKEYADWYMEIVKTEGSTKIARNVFTQILTTLHPFMPFITETLWQHTGEEGLIAASQWQAGKETKKANKDMQYFIDLVSAIRTARTLFEIPPSSNIDIYTEQVAPLNASLETMTKATIASEMNGNMRAFPVGDSSQVSIESDQITPESITKVREKLGKELAELAKNITQQEEILSHMEDKADVNKVEEKKQQIASSLSRKQELERSLELLK